MADLQSYDPIVQALKEALPDKIEQVGKLREMVAFAESYGIIVSEHRRQLLVRLENETAIKLQWLKDGVHLNEDNEIVKTKAAAEKYAKANADEKKIMLAAEVSSISAELEFVTNLENLIKRRCSLGQSISNSFNTETQSSFNK